MANSAYLASTLVMGLLVVAVVAFVLRARPWYHYTPQLTSGEGGRATGLSHLVNQPRTWMVLFFLLTLGFLAGVVLVAGGATTQAVLAAFGLVLLTYLLVGVYLSLRAHGRPHSLAVAGAAVTLGVLVLIGVVYNLVAA